jgi:hypothetical protein
VITTPAWVTREVVRRLTPPRYRDLEVPMKAIGLERVYAQYRQALSIIPMIAGSSYPELNRKAAWLAARWKV